MSTAQYCHKTSKRCFPTQESALTKLRNIRENPDPVKHALGYMPNTVYRCKSCDRWHLSATAAQKYTRRRRRKGAKAYR